MKKSVKIATLFGSIATLAVAYILTEKELPRYLTYQEPPSASQKKFASGDILPVTVFEDKIETHIKQKATKDLEFIIEWQKIGGNKEFTIDLHNRTEQDCFFTCDQQIGQEYAQYVTHAFDSVFRQHPSSVTKNSVLVPGKDAKDPTLALIVAYSATVYTADVTLQDKQEKKVTKKRSLTTKSPDFGSMTSAFSMIWGERLVYQESPIILTLQGNLYERLETPVAEILHAQVRHATRDVISERITRDWPKEVAFVNKINEEWLAVEEAVVHTLSHHLVPTIAREQGIYVKPEWITERKKVEYAVPKYRYCNVAEKLIDPKNIFSLFDEYISDPKKVAMKLGARMD